MILVEVARRRLETLQDNGWDVFIHLLSVFLIKYDILVPNLMSHMLTLEDNGINLLLYYLTFLLW